MHPTDLMFMTILTWPLIEATTIYKEVLVNATTNISCIPNEVIQIQWHHTPPGKSQSNYVYAGGTFYIRNRGFRLEKDSNTGPYHLVIPSARSEDAGLYECKEDATGSRMFGSTELTVLESSPVCGSDMKPQGYVGPSTCPLEYENMAFTCAVSFKGKPPRMIWTILNDSQSFNESACKIENDRIDCSLTFVKAESKYDGSTFNCQTTNSSANCSTEIIRIQYFEIQQPLVEKNVGDKVNCSVKSNQILKFEWTVLQDDERVFLTKEQTLLIQSLGLYQCEVFYSIGNVQCSTTTEVNVYNSSTAVTCPPPKGTDAVTSAAIIGLSIFVVILIVVIIVLAIRSRRARPARPLVDL